MTSVFIGLALPAVILALGAGLVIQRGLQMRLLAQDGVETTGRVVARLRQVPARRKGSHRPVLRIHYAYRDGAGAEHEHRSRVTEAFWNEHADGGPIAVVYAKSRPQVSAPKQLVEHSRAALAKRQ